MAIMYITSLILLLAVTKARADTDVAVGTSCIVDTDTCVTGAECDTTATKCLLSTGSSCASPNADNCITNNVCENSVCKVKATKTCATVDDCVANTECLGSSLVCTCKSGFTAQAAGTCLVTPNTLGGACSAATSNAADPCANNDANAVCTNSVCVCKSGYTGSTGGKCSGAMGIAGSIVLLVSALLIKVHLV